MAEKYVFTGRSHRHNGVSLKPGDVVELDEAQAKAFGDKFRKADEPEPATPPGGPKIAQTSSLPQDVAAEKLNPNRPNPDNKVGMTPGVPTSSIAPSPMVNPAEKDKK